MGEHAAIECSDMAATDGRDEATIEQRTTSSAAKSERNLLAIGRRSECSQCIALRASPLHPRLRPSHRIPSPRVRRLTLSILSSASDEMCTVSDVSATAWSTAGAPPRMPACWNMRCMFMAKRGKEGKGGWGWLLGSVGGGRLSAEKVAAADEQAAVAENRAAGAVSEPCSQVRPTPRFDAECNHRLRQSSSQRLVYRMASASLALATAISREGE